jgi:PAS domain-containing protein
MPLLDAVIGLVFGLAISGILIWWLVRVPAGRGRVRKGPSDTLSFLFENDTLVDTSQEAERLLAASRSPPTWEGVTALFRGRFDLPEQGLAPPETDGIDYYRALDASDTGLLEVRRAGEKVRLDIYGRSAQSGAADQKLHVLERELHLLRCANEVAPFPIWQSGEKGRVTWHNPAYAKLYREILREEPGPDRPLFDIPPPKVEDGTTRRVPISPRGKGHSLWFDIQRSSTEHGDFYSAVDANAIVRAEAAQRNFVQTLAKTFAHLPIGLAIFDENRELVLFNPAVIDLTGLGADFLSSRPNLLSFFDELRNRRLMPEPKNYNSWRQQIADLVAAAADGRYSETWTLDYGRTYRVNGRPHPDGAIAFLIEDISAEVSLTRKFRAELELGQSVLDHMDQAIAVFNSTGILTVSNAAYRALWATDPEVSFADVTIVDCLQIWQERCEPSPVFGDLRDAVLEHSHRVTWDTEVTQEDGERLSVDVIPLISGSTMIRFMPMSDVQKSPRGRLDIPVQHET